MLNLQIRLLARKDSQAWLVMAPYERLQAGAKAAADQIVADLKLKQRQVSLPRPRDLPGDPLTGMPKSLAPRA